MFRAAPIFLASCVAVFPLAAFAQADLSLPARKPGLWEIRMVTERPGGGMPPIVTQVCIDAATDREMMESGLSMSRDMCKRQTVTRQGQSWVVDAECAVGGKKSVSRTTISGDFNSNITIRVEGTAEGSGPMQITMAQTWKGASCGGMAPGDVSMPGGLNMNMKQLKDLEKALPKIQIR